MKLRNLILSVVIIILIVLNALWGNAISWMLCTAIVTSLIYYLARIGLERSILLQIQKLGNTTEAKAAGGQLLLRRQRLLVFVALTVVFISSIFCIRNVAMPREDTPYFYNNQYHALSQKAILFDQSLRLHKRQTDGDTGSISLSLNGTTTLIAAKDFYAPIIAIGKERELQLLNPIYNKPITRNLVLSRGGTSISIALAEDRSWWEKLSGKKGETIYTITVASNDAALAAAEHIAIPYTNTYRFSGSKLQEGMSLYNLFFENKIVDAPASESLQILQSLLQEMGNCYLLVNKGTPELATYFFPSQAFVSNGFKVIIDGTPIAPNTNQQRSTNNSFFIGFHNQQDLLSVGQYTKSDGTTSKALLFDHPPMYWLTAPDEQQTLGSINNRFLTNDMGVVIDGAGEEGFYFSNYGLYTSHPMAGQLAYAIGRPTDSLLAKISDASQPGTPIQVRDKFELKSLDKAVAFAFEIRDFSNNGFSFSLLLRYAAMAFLALLFVLLFFSGKHLARVEPVIFITIYTLIILRMLMYWRLATFPPLDNISKFELEQTIINFDFNFGIQWPVPLTLIWLFLFLAVLVLVRVFGKNIGDRTGGWIERFKLADNKQLIKKFTITMGAMLVLFLFNDKVLHMEILNRVLAIISPLIVYCLFASISNKYYTLRQDWVPKTDKQWLRWLKSYPYYFINNPAFVLSLITLAYFALTDRGFAILFLLFLLLKNILFSFLKKPYDSSEGGLIVMLRAYNYWVFGFLALVVYLVVLAYKPLFYYGLLYAVYAIGLLFLLLSLFFYLFKKENGKLWKIGFAVTAVYLVMLLITPVRQAMEKGITHQVRHVQYRVSMLHQPISKMLQDDSYSSFNTRKIIETAENQWFINSYISKPYDNSRTINLRPYNRVGVNYNTQTRDVVLPRFVIGEMGNMVMYLILLLTLLPLVIYLISYHFANEDGKYYKLQYRSYAGAIPLIILFTICLFVWLTATNRFVFFGQDFPFLSLTSRLSVVLPLLLFGFALVQKPKLLQPQDMKLSLKFARYAVFFIIIGAFALITVKPNELNSKNFSVVVDKTQRQIDQQLNALLLSVQDSLGPGASYVQMVNALKEQESFKTFYKDSLSDKYTRSIIDKFVRNPYSAFEVNSPIYMQYDGELYTASYNQHFYLELPTVESQKAWHGNVVERITGGGMETALLSINKEEQEVSIPYFKTDLNGMLQIAILPGSWLPAGSAARAILNVQKGQGESPKIYIYQGLSNNYELQSTSFATAIGSEDLVNIDLNKGQESSSIPLHFSSAGQRFAINKWVNGKYQLYYPTRPQNLWIYHFANAVKSIYDTEADNRKDFEITLDISLNKRVEKAIHSTYDGVAAKNKRFRFAVVAADGEGRIRLMQDLVANRRLLDINDQQLIYEEKQKQFFYSNIRNERDQWGNACLLSMQLGPGSSIKPLIASTVASQVNAGWQSLVMSAPVQASYDSYAGFKMAKPWKNADHYRGQIGLRKYIEASSNYYQSLMMFLGSYPKSAFVVNNNASLKNVLAPGSSNSFPRMFFNGASFTFPNYNGRKGNWPGTDYGAAKKISFFGNENSVLANGLEVNANLQTKDKSKEQAGTFGYGRVSILDSTTTSRMQTYAGANYLWAMPEPSTFLQSLRAKNEIHENFNIGMKTSTLGGYPYQLSPFKMLEMYGSMMTQNRMYRLAISERDIAKVPWYVDSSWNGQNAFTQFMASQIFGGMHDVVHGGSGTAGRLGGVGTRHGGLFVYAKTGTINEEGSGRKSSRRLIVTVANKDLQQVENVGNTKLFTFYFMIDYNQDFDWMLLNSIIDESLNSKGVKAYFSKP